GPLRPEADGSQENRRRGHTYYACLPHQATDVTSRRPACSERDPRRPAMIDPSKLAEMMQKAQQMQEQLQQELAQKTVVGEAGGGMVRVVLNGMMEVKSVKIEKAAIDPSDPTLLEDLVRAAISQ